jgi:hypothetical protein
MGRERKTPLQPHERQRGPGQPSARWRAASAPRPKAAAVQPARQTPPAPPAYRPQPAPKVLQTKAALKETAHAAPPFYRPRPAPAALQREATPRPQPSAPQPKPAAATAASATNRSQPTAEVLQRKAASARQADAADRPRHAGPPSANRPEPKSARPNEARRAGVVQAKPSAPSRGVATTDVSPAQGASAPRTPRVPAFPALRFVIQRLTGMQRETLAGRDAGAVGDYIRSGLTELHKISCLGKDATKDLEIQAMKIDNDVVITSNEVTGTEELKKLLVGVKRGAISSKITTMYNTARPQLQSEEDEVYQTRLKADLTPARRLINSLTSGRAGNTDLVYTATTPADCAAKLNGSGKLIILNAASTSTAKWHAEQNLLRVLLKLLSEGRVPSYVMIQGVKKPCYVCLAVLQDFNHAYNAVYGKRVSNDPSMGTVPGRYNPTGVTSLDIAEFGTGTAGTQFNNFVLAYRGAETALEATL